MIALLKTTWTEFSSHNGQWLAAALAYFTAFAIAPLIIIIVEIAGFFLGSHQSTLNLLYGYMQRDAGPAAAGAIKGIVSATFHQQRHGTIAQIVGWAVFVLAAVGLFSAVQFALNTIWDVVPKKQGFMTMLKERGAAFAVMMVIALLLFASMGVNAVMTVAATALSHVFPGFATIAKILDFVVSFGVIWVAFAVLFEYLPDTRIEFRDVWTGAALTSLLFVVGQFLLGWYLGRAGVTSSFGAFGALVVFLIWTNYSSQIMLFGAAFTKVYAQQRGSLKQSARSTHGEVSLSADRPLRRPT
ncbi:MAG TPA: YihY/virulence factor BrkB family protein [Candidatus Baltobacteraceae bacterium]|nr:YihY/virulence factor BrkB family protein [Candidatus Baltobacteraceae bacterium]